VDNCARSESRNSKTVLEGGEDFTEDSHPLSLNRDRNKREKKDKPQHDLDFFSGIFSGSFWLEKLEYQVNLGWGSAHGGYGAPCSTVIVVREFTGTGAMYGV